MNTKELYHAVYHDLRIAAHDARGGWWRVDAMRREWLKDMPNNRHIIEAAYESLARRENR